MIKYPKVACICITQLKKLEKLEQAIYNFYAQEYPEKELLIVIDGDDKLLEEVKYLAYLINVELFGDNSEVSSKVKVLLPPKSIGADSLGGLRNYGVRYAKKNADMIATWDDDDLSHPKRLKEQVSGILATESDFSYMTSYVHMIEGKTKPNKLYIIGKAVDETALMDFPPKINEILENTMVGYIDRLPCKYALKDTAEDTEVNKQIIRTCKVYSHTRADRFIYRFCGDDMNAWGMKHHMSMINNAPRKISNQALVDVITDEIIKTEILPIGSYDVFTRNGKAKSFFITIGK